MKLILSLSISILFFSCNQNFQKSNALPSEENREVQVHTIDEHERFETLDIIEFEQTLASENNDLSAKDVMRLYYPYQIENTEGTEEIKIEEKVLANGNTLVILIHDNLMDDSVKGEKYLMELKKSNTSWKLISIKKNWKCYDGRGHTDWDTEFCL